jgi:hypothetical protein
MGLSILFILEMRLLFFKKKNSKDIFKKWNMGGVAFDIANDLLKVMVNHCFRNVKECKVSFHSVI